ncbi:hypothetical protein BGZ61DRAFT_182947 [Ilyonectria robusta]|uniref:uncharacterized protein n=1 Tax=Ilyonectria robusta TaxID=1079257 RepID=UPI001E8D5845|nr:uncharacterized protein BGZ61DRAFT_182947 [Ilyonectria robusta]KAH8729506.1 hypothetical protein BGZ61DRAFT_182947 [Ilyonectria robusta]
MIATENVAMLEGLFHIGMLEHKERLCRWSDWPVEKQRAVLDILRTGAKTQVAEEALLEAGLYKKARREYVGGGFRANLLGRYGIVCQARSLRNTAPSPPRTEMAQSSNPTMSYHGLKHRHSAGTGISLNPRQ